MIAAQNTRSYSIATKGQNMNVSHAVRLLPRAIGFALFGAMCAMCPRAYADSPTVTVITYDPGNNAATVTDPRGLMTTYSHDGLGQLWQQVSPDTGKTNFAYDAYGRRFSMTRADLTQSTYSFDGLSRVTSINVGGQTQSFAYDNCTNGVGRLCSDSDATGATSYSYTPEGWTSGRGFSIAGTTYALGYSHDSVGHVTSVQYPDGNRANYVYTNGQVSSVTLNVGGATVNAATTITYRPADMAMAQWTSSNGLVNTWDYDTDGRLIGISVPGIQNLSFGYDAANRITHIANGIDPNMTETVAYDAMSRVTSMQSAVESESYQYDANGNRSSGVVNGLTTTSVIDPSSNRMISANNPYFGTVTSGFDAQGNTTTTNQAVSQQYNPFNRLSQSGGATFYVNPEGQRLRKAGGSTGVTYFAPDAGGALVAESDNGTWVDYVRLNGLLIGRVSGGQVAAIQTDQIGRPDTVTDASRNVTWHARNFPFTSTVTLANITLNLGFPGQYFDAETWLWNNGYRDYNAGFGRYIESDPIGLGGGVNTYVYVQNNPLSKLDLLGLEGIGSWNNGGNPTIFETGNVPSCNMDPHFYRNGMAAMGLLTGFAIGTTFVVSAMTTPETAGGSAEVGGNVIAWLMTESAEPYATASIVGGSGGAAVGSIAGGIGGAMLDSPNAGNACPCNN